MDRDQELRMQKSGEVEMGSKQSNLGKDRLAVKLVSHSFLIAYQRNRK